MAQVIDRPAQIGVHGNKEKIIKEFIGRVNSQTEAISIAQMDSPEGWKEPGQTPEFDEYTVVLEGTLRVQTRKQVIDVHQGQAIIANKGEWVQYSSPFAGGARYVAVCLPAFSPDAVHRDEK
jgi:quercetin dioxygenase-like cupin family protein